MEVAGRHAALVADGVSVAFGGIRALSSVSLTVAPGEIVGIIGPNGAGKTTLFDCICGHLQCAGRVRLGDRDLTSLPPHARAAAGVGRSYQDARLYPTLTVRETLMAAGELRMRAAGRWAAIPGWPAARRAEKAAARRAEQVIERLGLAAYASKFVRELSTGTRRIVDLGCLLIQRPRIILFDEPSSGIAQREAEALGPLLRTIRDETGAGLVVIEHDMPLLLGVADRLYALETGFVIAEGDPAAVVRDPAVVRSYLGDDATAINRSGAAALPRKPRRRARAGV
jgi:ABC-type branched-subunit amino acid transport system ATPase component